MPVEIREETLELRTYAWGEPDPNPPFESKANWPIYPYPLLDDIREDARPVAYRALVLENECLRVVVLPELGGRLYSAIEKATGDEVFYRNHVVKPGLLGLRGAWISGGVEWNFPCGHSVTTVSPVDAKFVCDDDGSATVWVGNVEQVSRMSWHVGIRLRPGSSVIETEVRLANTTALPHPYYFWANAAVPARDDLRLIYPGTRARSWMGQFDWPIHEGKDLSRYTALDQANDVFMLDSLEDFFGVYYDQADRGLVHVADVHQSFGKKYFTWGTAEHARMWSSALSDGDGPYCEIQSGRFVDQSTWQLMPPHHTERWTEYWYPVRGLGGFTWANREAAVQLARSDRGIDCGIAVTAPHTDATIRVAIGGRAIDQRRADLMTGEPLSFAVRQAKDNSPVTLTVSDSHGREIARYTEQQRPRTIALREAPKLDEGKPGGLLVKALRAQERADPDAAWELCEKALMLDPGCEEAALALGRIAIERKPWQAVQRLESVTAALPESAAAAYYLGVALTRAGRDQDAQVELWRAAHQPEFAHAARVELGMVAMRRGDWERAATLLRDALSFDPRDAKARALLSATLRKAGRPDEAMALLRETTGHERLGLFELYLTQSALGRPRLAARAWRGLAAMLPHEPDAWLELALDYAGVGLLEDAVELLTSAEKTAGLSGSPLACYLRASLLSLLGRLEEASAARKRAAQLPANLSFAHHWEFESVLKSAIEEDPGDTRARYHLGSLLYSQGRREAALAEWEAAASGEWDYSVLRRNLALAYRQVKGDLARAETELRRAVELSPSDVRLYLELNDVLVECGALADVRLAALDAAPPTVQRRGSIAGQQAMCCIELEQWDRALDILTTHTFHRWEMEFRMRGIWLDACLGRGTHRFDAGDLPGAREDFERALEYPANLRIGRPARPTDARPHWCAGVAEEALGNRESAISHWRAAAAEVYHEPGSESAIYRALALIKLGSGDEAIAVLRASIETIRKRLQEAVAVGDRGHARRRLAEARALGHPQFLLGLALRGMGEDHESEQALRRAIELDKSMSRARRLLKNAVAL